MRRVRGGERTRLENGYTVVLEHVQEGCLSSIVKTEEEKLGVLVGETERGQKIEHWVGVLASCAVRRCRIAAFMGYVESGKTYTWTTISSESRYSV